MKYSEEDVIQGLLRGDVNSMKMLFDNYYQALCVYALRFIDSFEDAEDVVQDVFLSFWEARKGKEFEGSLRSYLFGAVRKRALRFVEETGRHVFENINDHLNDFLDDAEDMDGEKAQVEKEKLYEAVNQLPDKSREVFLAIVLDNMSYKAVAVKLGISVNTVKTHYARALVNLREYLKIIVLILIVH